MTEATSYQPRREGRRTGRDRRAAERRARQRRQTAAMVATERRERADRRDRARRTGMQRRTTSDRRRPPAFGVSPGGALGSMEPSPQLRRAGVMPVAKPRPGELSQRDRGKARLLPDDFMAASGNAVERLSKIIRRAWPRHPVPVRAMLAEGLLPILKPLLEKDSPGVTPGTRQACEDVAQKGLLHRH